MCYEYDWMQEVTTSEEARDIRESAEQLTNPIEAAPPPKVEEAVPA